MPESDPDAVSVRAATRDDIPALAEFIEPFVEEKRILPRTPDELDELVAYGYVAVLSGRIVGFAALEVYSAKLAEIRSLAVSSELRGRGLGKRLVEACVNRARDENVLEVMAITSIEPFFRTCGFDFTLPGEKKAMFIQTRGDSE